jgi:Tol biopolymer transport system component
MTPDRWKRVESVFQGALDRDSGQRDAYLAEACRGDDALRLEVESLLASDARAAAAPRAAGAVLAPGTRVGRYEIRECIGSGGMGEVYRAHDGGLGREVAVKVLPRGLASDTDRLRRFEQEARAAGRLNHPHVMAVHDVGAHEGAPYLVLELLEGATLRAKLAAGPLPPARAAEIGAQAARGLAAAHARGIVHRDLKPENLFLTRDGHVKILDFGLAATRWPESGRPAENATAPGLLLGTPGYMAPEQVRGERADARADLFALGAVLFECLTGRRAFRGGNVVETLGAVLGADPLPELESRSAVPAGLVRVLRRCLEKDAEDRFQSARDLAFALESFTTSAPLLADPANAPARARRLPWKGLAAAALAPAAALAAYQLVSFPPPAPSYRQLTFRRGTVDAARFSPDGHTVYYSAAWDGQPSTVFALRLDGLESRSLDLPDTRLVATAPGEMAVLHGAAGRRILARLPLEGVGGARDVAGDVIEADWSRERQALALVRSGGGRTRLEFPAGRVVYETAGTLTTPRVSPGGDAVAVVDQPMLGNTVGALVLVEGPGRARRLSEGWTDIGGVAFSPDGREIWFSAAATGTARHLHAATRAGAVRLVARTPGAMILQDVSPSGQALLAHVHPRSEALAQLDGSPDERNLSWLDWTHATELSDDGRRLLFTAEGQGGGPLYSVFVRQPLDAAPTRLGEGHGTELSPDGQWVLAIVREAPPRLVLLPTGAGEARTLRHGRSFAEYHWAWWFPDGRRVLFLANQAGRAPQLFVQDVAAGDARPVAAEGVTAYRHKPITPDGARVLVLEPEPPRFVLQPVAGGPAVPLAGLEPHHQPLRWTADGRALFVRTSAAAELPVQVERLDAATGRRVPWRELAPADRAGVDRIGDVLVTPDGRSFVFACGRDLSELYLVDGLR